MPETNAERITKKVTIHTEQDISAAELHEVTETDASTAELVSRMKGAERRSRLLLREKTQKAIKTTEDGEKKTKLQVLDKQLAEIDPPEDSSDANNESKIATYDASKIISGGLTGATGFLTNGLDKAVEVYEKFTTFLSYHLAPVLEKLQNIKGLGMESTIESALGFLGLEKTILFKSVRKAGLIPEFEKNSKLDNEAITAMIAKSKEVMAANPQTSYGPQKFFEAATQQYAAKHAGQKNFKLADLAAFATSQEFLDSQSAEAKKMPAAPAAAPAAPAGSPAAAEVVKLSPLAAGVLTAEYAGKKLSLKCEDGRVTVDGTKKWKLVSPQTGFLSIMGEVPVEIQELKPTAEGLLAIKTKSPNGVKEGTLPQETIQKLLKHIADGTRYEFTFEGYNLAFMAA